MSLLPIIPLLLATVLANVAESSAPDVRPGGALTSERRRPGLATAPNVPSRDRMGLTVGRSFFATPWVRSPASTTARDGLGPLFNARACSGCHPRGGRGSVPGDARYAPAALVFRLGLPEPHPTHATTPDPIYGLQLQTSGAAPVGADGSLSAVPEGRAAIEISTSTPRRIMPRIGTPAYGPPHDDIQISLRLAPSLHGVGLLGAVDEATILARADPEDADGDGISGRPNRVPDAATGETRLGRFGHKARHPSVRQQTAAAFRDDIGITSELFPHESCTAAQPSCEKAPRGNGPDTPHEIRTDLLDAVVEFTSVLAVPARGATSAETARGEVLFAEVGCAGCHRPSMRTSPSARPALLADQMIWPYTDLLLHDMGPGLADGLPEHAATPTEWRTAPLWGLGSVPAEDRSLLHDGRAPTITEAILWHDGEAAPSRTAFDRLPPKDRAALLAFLGSL